MGLMRPSRETSPWAVDCHWVWRAGVGLADGMPGARALGTQLLLMLARLVLLMLIAGSSMVGARAWVERVKVRQLLLVHVWLGVVTRTVLFGFYCILVTYAYLALRNKTISNSSPWRVMHLPPLDQLCCLSASPSLYICPAYSVHMLFCLLCSPTVSYLPVRS